jgi:hypothetical protein
MTAPHACRFCALPSNADPGDQCAPTGTCPESNHFTESDMTPEEIFRHNHALLWATWTNTDATSYEAPDILDLEATLTGNCTDRAALMVARCAAAGIEVQQWWCRVHGWQAHAVVIEPSTGLVSDSQLQEMRPRWRRYDLSEFRPWSDVVAMLNAADNSPSST